MHVILESWHAANTLRGEPVCELPDDKLILLYSRQGSAKDTYQAGNNYTYAAVMNYRSL